MGWFRGRKEPVAKTPVSSKYHGVEQEPLLPEAESFGDLFGSCGPWLWACEGATIWIGDYVHQREPHKSWKMGPSEKLARAVMGSMIGIENDTISFEIILDDEGRAWVFAHYSLIIGSRYMANIDASTIP
jgi:hypothetical protein